MIREVSDALEVELRSIGHRRMQHRGLQLPFAVHWLLHEFIRVT